MPNPTWPILAWKAETTDIAYNWTISWDDVHLAALMLLDRISASDTNQTNHDLYDSVLQNNLNWCEDLGTTPDGTKATITPGGLCYVDVWGCLRYASNAAFLIFVYTDWTYRSPKPLMSPLPKSRSTIF